MYLNLKKVKNLPKITNKVILNIFGDEIINLLETGLTTQDIYDYLTENLDNFESSIYSFKKAVQRYKNTIKNENKDIKKGEKMKKKFILLANDKGGVGKTTLGTLLDLPNSIILNLDKSREIADIYPFKRIIDFAKVEEEENISLEDFLDILKGDETFEYIIVDTKGGINKDLIKILPYIDSVIIPIKIGKTSEKPSYEFISQLKDCLDELNSKEVKWAIIYNELSPKFLKKVDFKFELVDEYKNLEHILKNNLLGDDLKIITYFKRSEAITTREKEGKDIEHLMKKNFGAYLVVKKEIKRLNSDLKKII